MRDVSPNHSRRIDDAVEFHVGGGAKLQGGCLKCKIVVHGVVGDFSISDRSTDSLIFRFGLVPIDQKLAEVRAAIGMMVSEWVMLKIISGLSAGTSTSPRLSPFACWPL